MIGLFFLDPFHLLGSHLGSTRTSGLANSVLLIENHEVFYSLLVLAILLINYSVFCLLNFLKYAVDIL